MWELGKYLPNRVDGRDGSLHNIRISVLWRVFRLRWIVKNDSFRVGKFKANVL